MIMSRFCEQCNTEIQGKYNRFCDICRYKQGRKPTTWQSNDQIDAEIKRLYLSRRDNRNLPLEVKKFARQLGWPLWAVRRRAQVMGLCRTKEKPWTNDELLILERYAWMSDRRIQLKLREHGFHRTPTAITVKLKRMRFKSNTPYFTASGLAQAFGVDPHAILKWIKFNYLNAKQRGTDRVHSQRGDIWMIHERDVRKFIINHPMEFDIKCVDQLWFIDLIAEKSFSKDQLDVAV